MDQGRAASAGEGAGVQAQLLDRCPCRFHDPAALRGEETVALHARYHLTVVPPLPESRQRGAVVLGDERFKVLAEQVDRRVRLGRPLIQETINRLKSAEQEGPGPTTGEDSGHNSERARKNPNASPGSVDLEQTPPASAKVARGNPTFAPHPKVTSRANTSDEELNPRVTQNTDPKSATARLEAANEKPLSKWRMILSVFLPFAAGYYLSFLFRTINASISPVLASDFGLGAAETGLLASVYFLVFAGAQIPIGVLLDRYGPRQVQSVLLVIAVGGATLFGNADSFVELLVGRAMIGLGVAASLMAGLKAIVVWFPRDRVAFVNGGMIMLGSLGAVTATTPTDWLLSWIGWRSLFEVLTIATLATAGLIYFAVPKSDRSPKGSVSSGKPLTLRSIFSDPRFLRIAPLSATCIGSSWAMHSLWAASWLADVEGFDRQGVINQLFTMAIGISLGALLLGTLADPESNGLSRSVSCIRCSRSRSMRSNAPAIRPTVPRSRKRLEPPSSTPLLARSRSAPARCRRSRRRTWPRHRWSAVNGGSTATDTTW
jgi:predicted MFS family arabinose efflux permease